MKLYQIIMKVPDDFVPEEMELTASFKSPLEVCSEGFIGPQSFVELEESIKDTEFDADSYCEEVTNLDSEDAVVEEVSEDAEEITSDIQEDSEVIDDSDAEEMSENLE